MSTSMGAGPEPAIGKQDGAARAGGSGSAVPHRSEGAAAPGGTRAPGGPGSVEGQGSAAPAQRSNPVSRRSTNVCGAAGPWPTWALPQLHAALELAGGLTSREGGRGLAGELYRGWYAPQCDAARAPSGALAGLYRRAHARTSAHAEEGWLVLDRLDHVGPDGWWRTWNPAWAQARRGPLTRVLLSPHADRSAEFVALLTDALQHWSQPWLLACPTAPVQLARAGAMALFLPRALTVPTALINSIQTTLRPDCPPLCRPLAPGVATAEDPDNGMSFGEHRCHLVALAVRSAAPTAPLLPALAQIFAAHGVNPSTPHLSGRR